MGLVERRAIQAYQQTQYPKLLQGIHKAAGFEVPVEIDWDSIVSNNNGFPGNEKEWITDVFFLPLTDALKQITVDAMGKEALKKSLKKIVIKYDADTAPATNFKSGWPFENGILLINYPAGTNIGGPETSYYQDRVEAIRTNLEEKL